VAGARAECEGDRRRAADLSSAIARRLGGTTTLDPFEEIEAAKRAGRGAAAREHWDRAANSLEQATGARGRPVYLRLDEPLEEGFRRSSPAPAFLAGEVAIVAARGPGAQVEAVRLVEDALALGKAEALIWADGTARWLAAGRTRDDLLGAFALDGVATNASPWLAACDGGGLHLFDRREREMRNEVVRRCASKLVLGGEDRLVEIDDSIAVLELPSLNVLGTTPRGEGLAERWSVDRAGRTFALVEGGPLDPEVVVRVFDLARGLQVASMRRAQPAPLQIAVSPNGRKIVLVDETIQVFDVASRRTTSLGNRAFHKLRPGIYAHAGWGDTFTPPAATDSVAALDDGRACIQQAGTATIVPRSATDHCSIGEDHFARVGTVRSRGASTWVTPPASTEDSRSTVLVTPSGRDVLRVETRRRPVGECPASSNLEPDDLAYEPCLDESFVVTYDASSGSELRRTSIGSVRGVAIHDLVGDGDVVRLTIGGGSQEAGEPRLLDRTTGEISDDPSIWRAPWYMPSVIGGLLHVRKQPAGIVRIWDLRTLSLHGVDEIAPSSLPGLAFYDAPAHTLAAFSADTSDPSSRSPLATLVPMGDGLAVFFATGEIELFGVASPPDDLVCSYGRVLAPFETCAGTSLVEGAWQQTVARAAAPTSRSTEPSSARAHLEE
jgi:hypothetical protein